MPDELVAEIECGKRYYNPRTGKLTTAPTGKVAATELKIIDKPPVAAKGEVAVKLPAEKWTVDKKAGTITTAYELKKADAGAAPEKEA